jgi:hypothetical protein
VSPPLVLTLTLPAVSDETVDCTSTLSADATHWTVTESLTPPVWGVGTWTLAGSTHVHTTAVSGALTLYAWAYSAAGGVSVTPVSASTTVYTLPWAVPGCLFYRAVPPYGAVVGANPVTRLDDVVPVSAYPAGKTGPYHATSASGIQLLNGELNGSGTLTGSAAEFLALIGVTNDDDWALLYVQKQTSYPGGVSGPRCTSSSGEIRSIVQATQVQTYCSDGSGLPYHALNQGNALTTTDYHAYLYTYTGGKISLYTESGTVFADSTLHLDAQTFLTETWPLAGSQALEQAFWVRGDLSEAERLEILSNVVVRYPDAFPLA